MLKRLLASLIAVGLLAIVPSILSARGGGYQKTSWTVYSPYAAYTRHLSHVWVEGEGRVVKILPTDRKGRRHQKFIVALPHAQSVLISHNIDLAPEISGLRVGKKVLFRGEYIYNPKGGIVHWTHHDPKKRTIGGWIVLDGRIYR